MVIWSGLIQNVAGVDSNVGFFFQGFKQNIISMIGVGWYAQGEGVLNGIVTAINTIDETVTIEGSQNFRSGRSYTFTDTRLFTPCFKRGTKLLCLKNDKEEYVLIEDIKKGDLIKTLYHGYVKTDIIGSSSMFNENSNIRHSKKMYKCPKTNFPELLEDLYLTGGHCLLVDNLSKQQEELTIKFVKNIKKTDDKYNLMAFIDYRVELCQDEQIFCIYHIALEHDDVSANYGIYANGLLVESCSKKCMLETTMDTKL